MARLFMVAGTRLRSLLIAGWSLPEPPASFPDRPEVIERAANGSDRAPMAGEGCPGYQSADDPATSIEVAPAEQSVARLPDETNGSTSVDFPG